MNRRRADLSLAALPLLFLGYFFVYPIARILLEGLAPDGRLDLSTFERVLTSAPLRGTAWFTLWQAAASTVLTLAVALPGAYVFARFRFRGRRLLRAAVTVPFMLPTVVVGSAFLALLGPTGPLGVDLRGTIWAILAAHVFYNYAVVVRTVGGLWERLDPRLEEAARLLGASRWGAFRTVTLPLLAPAVAAASSIVFLFTFTSFGVILILGGSGYTTLEVEIWRQTTAYLDLPIAAALAVLQLAGVTAILLAYSRFQERRATELSLVAADHTGRRPSGAVERAILSVNLAVMAVLLGGPLFVLVDRSLRAGGGYGLDAYRGLDAVRRGDALFVPPVDAVANSLRFAAAAMLLAVVIGMLAAAVVARRRGRLSRWFDAVLMLPLGTSAVTVGFGFLLALGSPIDLRTSAILIPVAHALVAIPFVVRVAAPVLRSVPARLREAATVLGAGPGRVWREVDLPIVARAALVGAGFAFAISLGEFGATAFIVRPDTPTLPIAIYRLLTRPGSANFAQAMALSTILMVLTAGAVLAIDRFRVGEIGEF